MKKIAVASLLGVAGAACSIPVHIPPKTPPPFSMYGVLPAASDGPSTVALGSAPKDFVVTDVLIGSPYARDVVVNADGAPRLCCGADLLTSRDDYRSTSQHLTSGVLIAARSTITITGWAPAGGAAITLAGHLR